MKLEKGPEEGSPALRFVPSEAWIAAFQREYNGVMVRLVAGYAGHRVAGIGAVLPTHDRHPRELVVKALSDTLLGVVRWNPNAKTLENHIRDVIRRRSAIDWKRAKKYPHESIDATNENGHSPMLAEVDSALAGRQPDPQAAEIAAKALAELGQLAEDDPELLAYIEARADGLSRAELLRITGLSLAKYRKVRRRLARLVQQLSIQAGPRRGKQGEQS